MPYPIGLRTLALAVFATALCAFCSAEEANVLGGGPLTRLPEGWMHVPLRGTDAWRGVYLDRETGALVSYAIGKMAGAYVDAYKDAPRETGVVTKARLKYQLVRIPEARGRHTARLREEVGPSFDTVGTFEALLPPAKSLELIVSIPAGGVSYNFTAWVCGDNEERRIRQLLLDQDALRTEEPISRDAELPMPDKNARAASRSHRETGSCEALAKGASLTSILNSLGVPESVFRPRCGAAALFYHAAIQGKPRVCRVEFDDQQRLVAKEVR